MYGDIRTTSVDTVVYQQQIAVNRATPCAYKGRDDLNPHIPKWTYPLIVDSDYERFADWRQRCFEHGHDTVDVVSPTTGNSRRRIKV